MYWRSNSATTSPFFTWLPGLAALCRISMKSFPPPPPPPPPGSRPALVDPIPEVPIAVLVAELVAVVLLDEDDLPLALLEAPEATRLVEARRADDILFPPALEAAEEDEDVPFAFELEALDVTV